MRPRARGIRWGAAALVAGAGLAAVSGCRKQEDSLVEFALTADARAQGQRSVTLVAGNVAQTFALPSGLSATPTYFGVYVPSSLTGTVLLGATATPDSGCIGYHGTGATQIARAGLIVVAPIAMRAESTCVGQDGGGDGAQGGADGGGQGGAGGGGLGGAGGGGLGGAGGGQGGSAGGPTLASCREIDHDDTPSCSGNCSTADDVSIYGVAFSPNGQLMVTSGTDGRVKVWQVNGANVTAAGTVLTGDGLAIAAFSPDGTILAVARNTAVELWNVADWTLLRSLRIGANGYGTAFSPDGTQVITVDRVPNSTTMNSTLYVHAVGNVQPLHTATLNNAYTLAVSPKVVGGSLPVAVSTSNGTMLVYTLGANGFSTPTTIPVTGDGSIAEAVAFSPLGDLLSAGGDDGLLHFWPVPVTAATIPPDISIISASNDNSELVSSVAFAPDESYVAMGAGFFGAIGTWAARAPHAQLGSFYDTPNVYDVIAVAVSPDGRLIAGGEFSCGCVVVCPQ